MPQSWNNENPEDVRGLPSPPRWWTEYNNAELNELVQIALVNNYDLRAAVARVAQAEARANIANSGRLPTVDAVLRAEVRAPEFGIGTAPTRADYNTREIYQAGLRVAYEVDLWGKGSYQRKSALRQVEASVWAKEALAQTLIADVTTTYFTVLALRERVKLADANLDSATAVEKAVTRRVERGDASIFDQEQQGLVTADTNQRAYELRRQLASNEAQLAFLLGRPVSMLDLRGTTLSDVHVPNVNPGLPAKLLCRRPDIRRAEMQLMSARADVSVARRSLLPAISLTAEGGYGTSNLKTALSPQSLFTDVVGQIVQSVFDGGRRKADIAEKKGRERELLESYQQTILTALRDTEEALSGTRLTNARNRIMSEAAARALNLVNLSKRVYERGAINYTDLLESQRTYYRTSDMAVSARLDYLNATVDLYKAIGGGQSADKDICLGSNSAQKTAKKDKDKTQKSEDVKTAAVEAAQTSSVQNTQPQSNNQPAQPQKKARRW